MAAEVVNSCTEEDNHPNLDSDGSEGEEGEILDTDDSGFIPLCGEKVEMDDAQDSTSDDESPEEILNRVAKKQAEESGLIEPVLDPKLCAICQKTPHKYRCPKCDMRTCSASSSLAEATNGGSALDVSRGDEDNSENIRHRANSAQERFLIQNAIRRRIWLSFSDDKGGEDCSRHEQFSDTIFWCIDLVFTKQMEDGSASEYTYRVQNIPETIRLVTVLKQFLKPRQHGCIVSKSDLDMDKMTPFIEAGIENVNGFMLVPNYEPERYYAINFEKDLLYNTRNRVIVNHPRIIVTLNTEFMLSYQLVSEAEAEEIREKQRQSRAMGQAAEEGCGSGFHRGGRGGGFRGGRGGPRGGFRGGFHGGSHGHNNREQQRSGPRGGFRSRFDGKRSRDFDGDDSGFHSKRGRGGRGDRGRPNNYRSLDDEFDPFEPFEGPVRLPRSYLGKGDNSKSENGNAASTSEKSASNEGTV
ncbi:HIT zinc finger [Teladorsagia circumcincta]|uniref:HIT zinc finger n=1 Tax=Teladorsagia circumcincta TaxID=45464 RepID=A0A2G9V5A9_TELCI|nr:HIT zinc finger [Teladorsagia circumcincta]